GRRDRPYCGGVELRGGLRHLAKHVLAEAVQGEVHGLADEPDIVPRVAATGIDPIQRRGERPPGLPATDNAKVEGDAGESAATALSPKKPQREGEQIVLDLPPILPGPVLGAAYPLAQFRKHL